MFWRESHRPILVTACWPVRSSLGLDVGGCPGRSGRSVAPSPPGTLTVSDMNMLSNLPLMGSMTDGGLHPLFRDPRLVSRGLAHQRATAEACAVCKQSSIFRESDLVRCRNSHKERHIL